MGQEMDRGKVRVGEANFGAHLEGVLLYCLFASVLFSRYTLYAFARDNVWH